jgi:hypothetical protein
MHHRGPSSTARWSLATFTEHEVAVAIAAEVDRAGQAWVLATFVPLRAAFHLYSKDLPRAGLNGIGRPTLLEIVSSHGLTSTGSLTADQPSTSLYVPALALTFPVYPDGPVTLRVPVARVPSGGHDATLSVTYMACSGRTCLPPVVDKRIAVSLPIGYLRASAPPN